MPVADTIPLLDAEALEAAMSARPFGLITVAECLGPSRGTPNAKAFVEAAIRAYLSRAARQQDTGTEGAGDKQAGERGDGTNRVSVSANATATPAAARRAAILEECARAADIALRHASDDPDGPVIDAAAVAVMQALRALKSRAAPTPPDQGGGTP
jgi:hypothetical protein